MYKCNWCGKLKSEKSVIEKDGLDVFVNLFCECGGEFEKAKRCEICGEYYLPNEIQDFTNDYNVFYEESNYKRKCPNCLRNGR